MDIYVAIEKDGWYESDENEGWYDNGVNPYPLPQWMQESIALLQAADNNFSISGVGSAWRASGEDEGQYFRLEAPEDLNEATSKI